MISGYNDLTLNLIFQLGGLQFDREVRAIVAYLSQVSEWGVREQLARLTQIATLLNLEVLSEVNSLQHIIYII